MAGSAKREVLLKKNLLKANQARLFDVFQDGEQMLIKVMKALSRLVAFVFVSRITNLHYYIAI
jgi:hypothetical protein